MRYARWIPIAALAFALGCSEQSSDPVSNNGPSIGPPSFGNVHFIKSATSCERDGLDLVCTFKEAGLEAGSSVLVTLNATGTATYVCRNNGNNVPSDPKKTDLNTDLTVSEEFDVDKNGNIVGRLTLSPPGPGDFTCPSGQRVDGPTNVSYSDVSIVDTDNTKTFIVSGSF